jgi:RNA polymerase sigma-70 factor (ECF subfamily)
MTLGRRAPWPLRARAAAPAEARRQRIAVRALAYACDERDFSRIVRVLHPDAVLVIDSGGRVPAPLDPVGGRARIVDMLVRFLDTHPEAVAVECPVNGEPGIALHTGQDIVGVLTVGVRAERISRLWLVVNPDKLRAWNA